MIKLFSVLAILLMSFSVKAAGEGERITNAILNSNTNELTAMFNSSINLQTPGSSGITTKEQSRIVLDNFFKNNIPVKANLIHETSGTTNGMYVISLQTKTSVFRITVSGTFKNGSFIINEFRIN